MNFKSMTGSFCWGESLSTRYGRPSFRSIFGAHFIPLCVNSLGDAALSVPTLFCRIYYCFLILQSWRFEGLTEVGLAQTTYGRYRSRINFFELQHLRIHCNMFFFLSSFLTEALKNENLDLVLALSLLCLFPYFEFLPILVVIFFCFHTGTGISAYYISV